MDLAGLIDLGVVLLLMGFRVRGLSPSSDCSSRHRVSLSRNRESSCPRRHFLGVSVAYLTACWATTGRTVGSLVMGLRVITSGHRLVRWPLAFIRAVLCVLFAFGLLWSAVDRRRRSLQDNVLRTEVVYDWRQDPDLVAPHGGEHA